MKSLIAVAALLTVSSVAYADVTTSPTMPFSFCAHEYAAGYGTCTKIAPTRQSEHPGQHVQKYHRNS